MHLWALTKGSCIVETSGAGSGCQSLMNVYVEFMPVSDYLLPAYTSLLYLVANTLESQNMHEVELTAVSFSMRVYTDQTDELSTQTRRHGRMHRSTCDSRLCNMRCCWRTSFYAQYSCKYDRMNKVHHNAIDNLTQVCFVNYGALYCP